MSMNEGAAAHVARIEAQRERDLQAVMRASPELQHRVQEVTAKASEHLSAKAAQTAPEPSPLPVIVDAAELLQYEFPPRTMILSPWLRSQSLNMIHAWRGIGKTHVSLGIAFAIASGGTFLGWEAEQPQPVLFVDGEMPGAALRERVARIVASADAQPPPGFLRFFTPDLQPEGMPNLATWDGQSVLDSVIGDAQLIVLDNLSCLARGGRENEAESWQPMADWGLRQRAAGRSVLFIHHSGKGGAQRGTSKREDLLDNVITLRRPADYTPQQGARFIVEFEKGRDAHGGDVEGFEATLETLGDARQSWSMKAANTAQAEKIIELAELGEAQADIARELGVHRSTVLRALRKAEQEGQYTPTKGERS